MAWWCSGLGHRPLKAKIGGSNPLQATTNLQKPSFEGFFLFLRMHLGENARPARMIRRRAGRSPRPSRPAKSRRTLHKAVSIRPPSRGRTPSSRPPLSMRPLPTSGANQAEIRIESCRNQAASTPEDASERALSRDERILFRRDPLSHAARIRKPRLRSMKSQARSFRQTVRLSRYSAIQRDGIPTYDRGGPIPCPYRTRLRGRLRRSVSQPRRPAGRSRRARGRRR